MSVYTPADAVQRRSGTASPACPLFVLPPLFITTEQGAECQRSTELCLSVQDSDSKTGGEVGGQREGEGKDGSVARWSKTVGRRGGGNWSRLICVFVRIISKPWDLRSAFSWPLRGW